MNPNEPELTPEEFAEMEAAEWEITTVYGGQMLATFLKTASDEEIVRSFLQGRVAVWQQLPYDWMDMDAETLESWNILDYPDFVRDAYKRSRTDPKQRAEFEKDYQRDEAVSEWVEKLEASLTPKTGN